MKQIFSVLQAFLTFLWGILRVCKHKLLPPESRYRLVVYQKDGTPSILWDRWAIESVAVANGILVIDKLKGTRVVLERLVYGRWTVVADTHLRVHDD